MKSKLLILLFFGFSLTLAAQITVTGTVTDANGQPLPGASVLVKGTTTGAQTDFDGNFTLDNVPEDGTLIFSYVGFTEQEVPIGGQTSFDISLEESAQALEEVVVVGYGSQRKADVTGSISQVKAEEITKQPALTGTQAIQGKAAGIQITPSGGPGSTPSVVIRGLGTAFGGRDPLYVVDGVITSDINNISPNDIKSIDVLKDASSLAIYGNRGANGVIVVTTKKGKSGKIAISYDVYSGFKTELRKVDMANASQFVTYFNEAAIKEAGPDGDPDLLDTNQSYDTDWFDEITRRGFVTNHDLSISGGNENVTSFFSANYFEEKGILKGNDYNRLTLRSNNELKINEWITFTQQASVALTDAIPKPLTAFKNAYSQAPILPVRYPEGDQYAGKFGASLGLNDVGNPVRQLFYDNEQLKNLTLQGTFGFEIDFTDWLTLNSRIGIESSYGRQYRFTPNRELFLSADPTNTKEEYAGQDSTINTLAVTHTNNYRFNIDNFLTFNKSFADEHTFKLTLGTTIEERNNESLFGLRENVPPQSDFWSLNNGDNDETQASSGGFGIEQRLRSYFARLNYDFKSKYLLTATYRRDGSSQFQRDQQYGNFFSVGLGWVVTSEDFMENVEFLNRLKIRGSFGELGNQNVPFNQVIFNQGLNYPFGPDQSINQGSTTTDIVDATLSWETTEEFDIGFEFAMLDNRLTGEFDYYNRYNRDAILPIRFPSTVGAAGVTQTSAGAIRNLGVEVALNWSDQVSDDFSYSFGGNISFNSNELEKITNPFFAESTGGSLNNGQSVKKVAVGQPLGSFYLYNVEGIDQDTGEFIFTDTDGSGDITDDDRQYFGSYQPDAYYGVNFSLNYKNIDFSVDGYGSAGAKVYDGEAAQRSAGKNIEQRYFDSRFTFDNPSNTNPIAGNDVPLASTFYLESGDFFKINNITLGYTIPMKEKSFLNKVRVYATAQQPFIWQKYGGFTPELQGSPLGNGGIELSAYPSVSSYLIGLNLSL